MKYDHHRLLSQITMAAKRLQMSAPETAWAEVLDACEAIREVLMQISPHGPHHHVLHAALLRVPSTEIATLRAALPKATCEEFDEFLNPTPRPNVRQLARNIFEHQASNDLPMISPLTVAKTIARLPPSARERIFRLYPQIR